MSWSTQASQMARAWTEAQEQIWRSWSDTLANERSAGKTAWDNTVAAWRQAVDRTLDTQAEWVDQWAEQAPAGEQSEAWAKQGVQAMRHWLVAQRQLWAAFFDVVGALEPEQLTAGGPAGDVLQAWQQSAQQMMELQSEWLRSWTAR